MIHESCAFSSCEYNMIIVLSTYSHFTISGIVIFAILVYKSRNYYPNYKNVQS